MQNSRFFSARNVTYTAVLVALVVVLQWFGGTITFGFVSLNFTLVPIVLGAVLLGAWEGAFIGFVAGIVVLIQVITAGAGVYLYMWTESPIVTTLTCLLKTTIAGFLSGVIFQAIKKKSSLAATFVSAGIVPVINTALFILGCLCMRQALHLYAATDSEYASMNILTFILVGLVTFNFFFELAVNLLVSPALCRVTQAIEKQSGKKRAEEEK